MERPWKREPDGRAIVHYRINPTPPPATSLTPAQIVDAIKAGAETWMAANPKVVIVFDGTTTEPPVGGKNVVGFSANYASGVIRYPLSGVYADSFDMIFDSKAGWDWKSCRPPATACDKYVSDKAEDLQEVATHEWGHVLGLGHVEGELTMNSLNSDAEVGFVSRQRSSLGLGDVLGLREFYPCECPMPTIYRP